MFHPLTAEKLSDFEILFGERGACGGCWCMYWRIRRKIFESQKGDGNRSAIRKIVQEGEVPGILAYYRKKAVGWCAVAPREHFPVLENSRILKRVDEKPVWSVVCFFVEKSFRRSGLSTRLIRAAVEYVKSCGGQIIEGYPVEPRQGNMPAVFAYTGLFSAFLQAGFREVARRSPTRPIMRFYV